MRRRGRQLCVQPFFRQYRLDDNFRPGLVVEDAISGLRSGRAAGALTLAVCTSTQRAILEDGAQPDYIVPDLTR